MIAEWLSTGEGLGGAISKAAGSFGYDAMWASAITVAAVTMLAYAVLSIADAVVTERMGQLT
jgi:ABC-type nitrate/sulfonate/bicarbonate transport system permease component